MDDDASFEASVGTAGDAVLAELLGGGVGGADATDGSALGAGVEVEGVELEADSVLTEVGL